MRLLEETTLEIGDLDAEAMRAAETRIDNLTMPRRALGRICELAIRLSGMAGAMPPPVARKAIVTMAGDHGVVDEGVSLHGRKVTQQMVNNIAAGGAGVNVLARLHNARVVLADFGMAERDEALVSDGRLIDMNVAKGTANMAKGPAMNSDQARLAVENGIGLARRLAADTDVFGTGEMGIGNSTPATAIAACLVGLPPEALAGAGTGLDPEGVRRKAKVVEQALRLNRPDPADGLDVLAKVGGYEIGGIAGLILGAAARRRPVLVDGFISTAGLMIAKALCPAVMRFVVLAHASAEPGHAAMCEWLGERPLLDLGMRLGEGTGAAMAFSVVDAAHRILTEMATFDGAGVEAKI